MMTVSHKNKRLEKEISILREQLNLFSGERSTFSGPDILELSHKLDALLNEYEKQKKYGPTASSNRPEA